MNNKKEKEEEIWKPIVSLQQYNKYYEISNFGNVRNKNHYVLKQQKGRHNEYRRIMLIRGCSFAIHRLVAEAFLDKADFKYCDYEDISNIDLDKLKINHKDENPSNNHVDNLEWCTDSYNCSYGTRNERRAEKMRIPIKQYSLNGEFIKDWDGAYIAKKELNFKTDTHIIECCEGKRKTAYKYIWKYTNYDEE